MNRTLLYIGLVIITALFAYSNSLDVPFHFDDNSKIVGNIDIRSLDYFAHVVKGDPVSHRYIPERRIAAYLTFALNYKLNGLDVTGYHIVNLAIHIINAFLVYSLIILTFRLAMTGDTYGTSAASPIDKKKNTGQLIALFSALLFVCHPLQTQAVTYVVQRLSSLATMLYLFSLVMYIQARCVTNSKTGRGQGLRKPYYLLSLIAAVLAMKTKEIAFTLPIIIAVYEVIFFSGKAGKRILFLIPVLCTLFIIPLSITGIEKPVGELISDAAQKTVVQTRMTRLTYLYTQFRVVMTYIRLLFFPVNQSLLYEYPRYYTFFDANVYLSFIFLSSLFGSGVYLLYYAGKKSSSVLCNGMSACCLRLTSFGIFWFFITLSVESSIIPIIDVINEHRVYLPSAGFFIAAVSFVFAGAGKFRDRWHGLDKPVALIFVVIIMTLSFMTYRRNIVWQSDINLWTDVVNKHPGHPTALNNLGEAYAAVGKIDTAVIYFNKVIKRYPDHPEALSNLAVAYAGKGQLDRAVMYSERAININPKFTKGYSNLGVIYIRKGQPDKAIEYLKKAIDFDPGLAKAHYNLGYAYYQKGWVDEAIEEYLKAISLQPDYALAHYDLGVAYRNRGMADKAENHFQRARELQKQ